MTRIAAAALAALWAAAGCSGNYPLMLDTDGAQDVGTSEAQADAAADTGSLDASPDDDPDATATDERIDQEDGPMNDPYQEIFDGLDPDRLMTTLKEMTGYLPVTVDGAPVMITDRYAPASKANFRAYWRGVMEGLGLAVQELAYPTMHMVGEMEGHDLEAVIPGLSPDSVVQIVHYDSIGPDGSETTNPGVDDDMTGMAILIESARLLAPRAARLSYTVRLVAADYEEQAPPNLEGAHQYVMQLMARAAAEGFNIVSAIDHEQSGWNCSLDGGPCTPDDGGTKVGVYSCSGDDKMFDFPAMGDLMEAVLKSYSSLIPARGCLGAASDHYAFWEIGVPALVYSEDEVFKNPHFDRNGGDTIDKVDVTYFTKIARAGVTVAAKQAVIDGVP